MKRFSLFADQHLLVFEMMPAYAQDMDARAGIFQFSNVNFPTNQYYFELKYQLFLRNY